MNEVDRFLSIWDNSVGGSRKWMPIGEETKGCPLKSCDEKATKSEIRRKKSEVALGKMGSSVFHGGFSTFIALSVLAPADTYIFIVFYRMWFGILLFGIANGFLLLPVILSYIGTTETFTDHSHHEEESEYNSEKSKKYIDKLSPGYK